MIKLSLIISLLLFSYSCNSQINNDGLTWKEFVAEDAGFKVMLPCEPSKEVKTDDYGNGKSSGYNFNCKINEMNLFMAFLDHNPTLKNDLPTFLKYAEGDFLFAVKGKVLKKEELKINEFPARSFEIEVDKDKRVNALILVNDKGSLHVVFGHPESNFNGSNVNYDAIRKKIFDSIQIINK